MVAEGSVVGGRYRLQARLGKGGMGEVWEAVQEGLGRRVAVKALLPELLNEPELLQRFQREAQAAASLGHPNIVSISDFISLPGEPPLQVMELLVGKPLTRAIEEGMMSEARVAFIASQLLDALGAAHRAGIIHRDIKPDNVFLTSIAGVDDIVKVLDFGIAKLYGETEAPKLTMTGAVMGTPQFMSPEQARGQLVDARTDLFAVGTCMYQALSGRLPFTGNSFNALLFAIAEEPAPPLSTLRANIDPGFAAIVDRAMAKNPNARFSSAEEMRAALTPFLRGSAPAAMTMPSMGSTPPRVSTSTSVSPSAASSTKRAPVFAILAVVALLLLGGTALALYAAGVFDGDPPVAKTKASAKETESEAPAKKKKSAEAAEEEPEDEPAAKKTEPSEPTVAKKTEPKAKASATATATATTAAPAPAPTTEAAAPAGKPSKETGGKTAYLSSMSTNNLYTTDHVRSVATPHGGAVNACYSPLQWDPVDHQFETWSLSVDASGKVVSVGPVGSNARCAALDACMTKVFKSFVLGPPKDGKPGSMNIGYTSRAPWNP